MMNDHLREPERLKVDHVPANANVNCPCCGGQDVSTIYRVDDIPVHSCLLMGSRQEATGYGRGKLRLGFCQGCGFLFNTAFDESVHEYSQRYEETQGFSPTFNAFAKSLAQRLVDQYDLRGKSVLEIGCGKGEFLVLLCELGQCEGIGIDRSYVPWRTAEEQSQRVRFIQDFYGPKYAHLQAQFICCRHTFEHVAATQQFVADLRETIGDRMETLVFFEVPDTYRILREGAFWDIYYEHCSYFTLGSHARLFRQCGFDVIELALDYADQYIIQTARPANGPTPPSLAAEKDLDAVREAVRQFPKIVAERIDHWRSLVSDFADRGKRVVLWGSGSKGVSFLTTLQLGRAVEYVVDINHYKHGRFMPGSGQMIVPPAFMAEYKPDLVIAMNPIYVDEIRAELDRLGVRPELTAV